MELDNIPFAQIEIANDLIGRIKEGRTKLARGLVPHKSVRSGASVEHVQGLAIVAAIEVIVARAAGKHVRARAAEQGVIAEFPEQVGFSGAAAEHIVVPEQ